MKSNVPVGGSCVGQESKETVFIIFLFTIVSLLNAIITYQGNSPISAFLVGEIIIGLIIIDFSRMKLAMHVYQILLIYFYFSLVIFHSFNDQTREFYSQSYIISCLHCLFFVIGYHLISTKKAIRPVITPKQNILTLGYIIFGILIPLVYALYANNGVVDYKAHFLTYDEGTSLPIYKLFVASIFTQVKWLVMYYSSNPLVISASFFTEALLMYPVNGIKAPLVTTFCILIIVAQLYIFRLSFKWLSVLGAVACCVAFVLIGSTAFRGDLTLQSLFNAVTNIDSILDRWGYFILGSPESGHIRFLADILAMMENETTDFRYGFDFYRFFLYPFKSLFYDFELSSYNHYPVLLAGYNVSQGLYLGLGAELFWNFGWFFPLFSLTFGYALKRFTLFAFSGSFFGLVIYLILFKTLLWELYRGETNSFIMTFVAFFLGMIFFQTILKVRQVRIIAAYLVNFVVKRSNRRIKSNG